MVLGVGRAPPTLGDEVGDAGSAVTASHQLYHVSPC